MTDCVIVSTTVSSATAADELADAVIDSRLAACVQQMPVKSTYRWQGKIERAPEVLVVMKTRRELAEELMSFVRERHTYEVPELTVAAIVDGSPDYLEWITEETSQGGNEH
jgi:periplasmic divalent cation tolerance protein